MSGIAGIISSSAPAMAMPPRRMVDRMCHDGSRTPGYATYDAVGLRVGWVSSRPAPAVTAPTWSDSKRFGVLLLTDALTQRDSAIALAESYAHAGHHALLQLNGWFSGVVIDLQSKSVTLFNDRYGLGRIYYHESAQGFFFASEAKSLLAVLPHLRKLDPRGVAEVFSVGCVLQNRSLFANIQLLPPGSAWTFHADGRVTKLRYFEPSVWETLPALSPRDYVERLCSTFARIATSCSNGAAAVGLSLTGGLDSRAVMAWTKADPGALPCYTFGGPFRDCADVLIARRLAQLCRHPHTTIRIKDDFFCRFDELAERSVYLSDGAMDVSGAVELYVNREAQEIAPVRLTGNYGSEILRAHVAFRPGNPDRSLYTPEFNELLEQAVATYRDEANCNRLTFVAFKQLPWHHYARFSVERSQITPRSPFLDNELVALAFQVPRELRTSAQPLLQLIERGNPRLATLGTDRALRTRPVPLLSRLATSWQEFTAKAEYAYDYGMPRWLARTDHCLTRLRLERAFLGRHKFYHFRHWYRHQLSGSVQQHGLGPDADPFCFRKGAARRLVSEHLGGRANRTVELHRLLSLRMVERALLRAA